MTTESDPTPGADAPVPTWPEYEQLRDAVEAYLDHEPPAPSYKHVTQAFTAILGKHYRQKFRQAHGLSEGAETACIGRLVDGREECPHNVGGTTTRTLRHTVRLVTTTRHQDTVEMRASDDPSDSWFSMWGSQNTTGLELSILPYSWYNLGRTIHVILYPPERYR